jgi:hypothetical protein
MRGRVPWRGRAVGVALLVSALAGTLTACVSHTGLSGTCRYGLNNGQQGKSHCYHRPRPSRALVASAMSAEPMARALATWKGEREPSQVGSVGINQWAETTFAVDRHRLVTFDVQGRRTGGDEGYASHPRDPFPVSAVHPPVLRRLVAAIRARQPDTQLLAALLDVDAFSDELAWHISMISPRAGSSLVYYAAADGSGLCHGADQVDDALEPAPGIPQCPRAVLSGYFVSSTR